MDPLAQLKTIHLPESIHNYPIAPGWWFVAAIILAITIWLIVFFKKRRLINKAKKAAIEKINQQDQTANEIIATLKWTALQYFPRQQVAALFGDDLQNFLTQTLAEKHKAEFTELTQQAFTIQYQKQAATNTESLKQAALLWLAHALPLKKQKHQSSSTNEISTQTLSSGEKT
jgi:hypothetical protein